MSKLTKAELRIQHQVNHLLYSDKKLTFEEKEFIYESFHPGSLSDISIHSACFTPLQLAYDFALFASRYGVVVDMCAGIGGLTFASRMRNYYNKDIKYSICIERNPKFCEIGKRFVPKAEWICGDIFDNSIWDDIKAKHGKINCVISNPPCGKVTETNADRSWLKYTGSEIDMAAIEVALSVCKEYIDFILPHGSTDYLYSGVPYYREVENRKTAKLKKDIGMFYQLMKGSKELILR